MNRCRHRANTVCQIERGNAKVFRCAYRGWTYRNNGDLLSVTYQDGYDASFQKDDYGLSQVPRMAMYRGFIFGSLSPAGITLDEYLGQPVKDQIDLFVDLSPKVNLTSPLVFTNAAIRPTGSSRWEIPRMDIIRTLSTRRSCVPYKSGPARSWTFSPVVLPDLHEISAMDM
jgi:hypothetical protein